jgi:hypothetical protein
MVKKTELTRELVLDTLVLGRECREDEALLVVARRVSNVEDFDSHKNQEAK